MPLFAAHSTNLCATLVAWLLFHKLHAGARWLTTIRVFRVPNAGPADDGLGTAAQIGVVPLSPAGVRALAFFSDWEATASLLAVLAANVVVCAIRGSYGPAAAAGLLAAAAALGALAKVELDTVAALRRRPGPALAVGAVVGAAVAGALLRGSEVVVPDIGLASGATDLSAAVAAVNPELMGVVPPAALAGVIGVAAAAAASLLPPAAARAVRSGELVSRPPAWGRDMLLASALSRVTVGAALAAPLLTALLWCPPAAAVWGLGGDRLATLQACSLLVQGGLLAAAARPLVAGHLGSSLTVWYTRKHGFMRGAPTGKSGDATATAAAAAAANEERAAGVRAGEVARLTSRVVLYFTGKAALQVVGPAALLSGCGALALHGVASPPGVLGAAASRAVGLGVGGAAALIWGSCVAWNLLLFRIGYLTDVPAARVGA